MIPASWCSHPAVGSSIGTWIGDHWHTAERMFGHLNDYILKDLHLECPLPHTQFSLSVSLGEASCYVVRGPGGGKK